MTSLRQHVETIHLTLLSILFYFFFLVKIGHTKLSVYSSEYLPVMAVSLQKIQKWTIQKRLKLLETHFPKKSMFQE